MDYELEELVPILRRLAEKYSAYESTSITYERAEQLMGAILYCIHEAEESGSRTLSRGKMPAWEAYEIGKECVERKVRSALALYNKMLPEFFAYGNRCLQDTFARGLPAFFRRYDIQFKPQDTILTLDYPLLKDLAPYTGIDKIQEFIRCVYWEQKFLRLFPREYVINILRRYDPQDEVMVENLREPVMLWLAGHLLAGKPLAEGSLGEEDYLRMEEAVEKKGADGISRQLREGLGKLLENLEETDGELSGYFLNAVGNIAVRLRVAAENKALEGIFQGTMQFSRQ